MWSACSCCRFCRCWNCARPICSCDCRSEHLLLLHLLLLHLLLLHLLLLHLLLLHLLLLHLLLLIC